ncbi:hypothetical protein Y032_0016g2894 [Ancylostoma ceylanicum]|uniref:Uncharacterized protein n=1 Tax=Ancylostoma ceylanicum TaxID=53326 RepID=A0A016V4T7_9BILA|nr:hypothetical protein Y032_0016g2894 [Ancylostoma ceylanicum]
MVAAQSQRAAVLRLSVAVRIPPLVSANFPSVTHFALKAAPTEILNFEVSRSPCGRLPDNHNGNLNTEKKRPICGDTAVDTEPSVAILVAATPVNAIDLASYEWSSLMYHVA